MTVTRMDNVGIVVADLDAAIEFFTELGLDLEGRATVEGDWADGVTGLRGMRAEIAMMLTPDTPSSSGSRPPGRIPWPVTVETLRRSGETMALDMESIADQVSRAFRGESWHGPSVLEILAGVSAEDAAAHPIAGAHSIWEIVHHLAAGYRLVLRRVGGERAQLSPEEEWPPVTESSAEAWQESQQTLERLNQQLQSAVRAFPAERLSQELGSEYSAFVQFCGAPQHDLYHAGQIVMLKKALSARGSGRE